MYLTARSFADRGEWLAFRRCIGNVLGMLILFVGGHKLPAFKTSHWDGRVLTWRPTSKCLYTMVLVGQWTSKAGHRVDVWRRNGVRPPKLYVVARHLSPEDKLHAAKGGLAVACSQKLIKLKGIDGRVHEGVADVALEFLKSSAYRALLRNVGSHHGANDASVVCAGFSFGGAVSKLVSVFLRRELDARRLRTKVACVAQGSFPMSDAAFLAANVESAPGLWWLNMVGVSADVLPPRLAAAILDMRFGDTDTSSHYCRPGVPLADCRKQIDDALLRRLRMVAKTHPAVDPITVLFGGDYANPPSSDLDLVAELPADVVAPRLELPCGVGALRRVFKLFTPLHEFLEPGKTTRDDGLSCIESRIE